jgi:uncharacterized protein DUF4058
MPIHDWSRMPAGLFHDFHQVWSILIRNTLNRKLLPEGFTALVEQRSGPREGDILAIESEEESHRDRRPTGGTATMDRPTAKIIRQTDRQFYAKKANRIVVRHQLGEIVAVIEVVSPGNKDSARSLNEFTKKIVDFLDAGIHSLVVDLFPPTKRDPFGIHKAIWDQIIEEEFAFPEGCDRIAVSYEAGEKFTAYVEPLRVGEPLPQMPLFLIDGLSLKVPLEETYMDAWSETPESVRRILTGAQSK